MRGRDNGGKNQKTGKHSEDRGVRSRFGCSKSVMLKSPPHRPPEVAYQMEHWSEGIRTVLSPHAANLRLKPNDSLTEFVANFLQCFYTFYSLSIRYDGRLLRAMKVNELLLPHYDQEVQNTRRILAVVPDDRFSWKPHEKSMSLGRLASHVAELPNFLTIIQTDGMELATSNMKPFLPATRAEMLAGFEERATEARRAIANSSDEHLAKSWKLTWKGQEVFGGARNLLLQTTICHQVHHRAQLTVYLRQNDVVFPGVYGPSADEMAAFK
jgi:uncharacterized damage-inducible protein DinB